MATILTGSNGAKAVIDEDGGSSPAYVVDLLNAGSGPEQCPNCHKAAGKCICTSDEVEHALALDIDGLRQLTAQWIETLQTQGRALDTARAHVRLLQAQVAALQTDLLGAQTGISNLERRCTCHEQAQVAAESAEWERVKAQNRGAL